MQKQDVQQPNQGQDIREWSPRELLPDGGTILLMGKRRSGKTTTMMNMLSHLRSKFEFGFVFCGTAATRDQCSQCMPGDFVQDHMDATFLDRLMDFQDARQTLRCIRPIFIVMDDFTFNKKVLRSQSMHRLFANGRHHQMFFMLGLQCPVGIGPDARANIDVCFLHRDVTTQNMEKLHELCNVSFRDMEEFRTVMLDVTRNHRTLAMCIVMSLDGGEAHDILSPKFTWWRC